MTDEQQPIKPDTFDVQPTITLDAYTNEIYDATIEIFADFCHQQWSNWTNYQRTYIIVNDDGTGTVPAWAMERLKRQASTEYEDLTHKEKESDRVEARKFYKLLINTFFGYDPSPEG